MSNIRNVNQSVKEWIKNESIDHNNPMCLRIALAAALATRNKKYTEIKENDSRHYTKRLIEYDTIRAYSTFN
ncbi:MAG TPA: hypothetical protein VF233_13615 [Nitrososphaeraceae archaeon]